MVFKIGMDITVRILLSLVTRKLKGASGVLQRVYIIKFLVREITLNKEAYTKCNTELNVYGILESSYFPNKKHYISAGDMR